MWKIIILLLSALNVQLQAAAAAKPVEKEEKSAKQREVKARQASELEMTVDEALGERLPKELPSIIAEYGRATTDVEDVIHATEIALKKLSEIYELVRQNMPTREQLSLLSYGSGKEFDASVCALSESVLDVLFHKVFTREQEVDAACFIKMADDIARKLRGSNDAAYKMYLDLNKVGVRFPCFHIMSSLVIPAAVNVRNLWQRSGFTFRPKLTQRSRMACDACGAVASFTHPWMQPQYYHKLGCKTLAQLISDPNQASLYPIVEYGKAIPEDDQEYWQYTMGFLVRHVNKKAYVDMAGAKTFMNLLSTCEQLPGFATAGIFMGNYKLEYSEEEFKALFQSLNVKPPFYEEVWNLGTKKPKN